MKQSLGKIVALLAPLVALAVFIPGAAFAEPLLNPLGITSLTEFLVRILDLVILIAFPVLVLFIVYVGFLFIKAEGNPDELKKVREYFFWALVGGLLVLGGKALALGIQATVEALSGP